MADEFLVFFRVRHGWEKDRRRGIRRQEGKKNRPAILGQTLAGRVHRMAGSFSAARRGGSDRVKVGGDPHGALPIFFLRDQSDGENLFDRAAPSCEGSPRGRLRI
ncbi:MAG: hypothetical protein H6684_16560 [Deltaproteobacteria bacterium]|nr:hypothetical protein [Deltaproteobacteria bacterium]